MGETHEISHHNLADFEPYLGYATKGQVVGGISLQNTLEGPQFRPQPQPFYGKMVGYTPSSFADLVFADERIKLGLERGKSDYPGLINAKVGANEEDENEGETLAMIAIPTWSNFPSTQQCHYSANISPSHYPPPSHPQRPSLNQPQSLPIEHPVPKHQPKRNFVAKSL